MPRATRPSPITPNAPAVSRQATRPSAASTGGPGRRAISRPATTLAVERLDLLRVLLVDRLALQLHRGGQLVAAGLPFLAQERELLDLLDAGELLVGRVHAALDLGLDGLLAVLLHEARRHVRVQRDQRDVVGLPVPYRDRLADQRARRLHLRLDVRGRHVLAPRVDDQLLLAVDDLQVAVLVEFAHVARVEPAVVVHRLAGLVGLVAVAGHDELAADQHLAVVRKPDLGARGRRADRPDLDPLGRVARP